jgi:hypothetical protein
MSFYASKKINWKPSKPALKYSFKYDYLLRKTSINLFFLTTWGIALTWAGILVVCQAKNCGFEGK